MATASRRNLPVIVPRNIPKTLNKYGIVFHWTRIVPGSKQFQRGMDTTILVCNQIDNNIILPLYEKLKTMYGYHQIFIVNIYKIKEQV